MTLQKSCPGLLQGIHHSHTAKSTLPVLFLHQFKSQEETFHLFFIHHVQFCPFYDFLISKLYFHPFLTVLFIWKHDEHIQLLANMGKHQNFGEQFSYIGLFKGIFLKHHLHRLVFILAEFPLSFFSLHFVKLMSPVSFELDGIHRNQISH